MERFKPWKELILALRSIANAIDSGNGDSDDKIVKDDNIYILETYDSDSEQKVYYAINKNLNEDKFVIDLKSITYTTGFSTLGDILNQDGVDILNGIIKYAKANNLSEISIYAFVKETTKGNIILTVFNILNDYLYFQYNDARTIIDITNGEDLTLDSPFIPEPGAEG